MQIKQYDIDRRHWSGISPWIIIGAVLVLLPIFLFITQQSLNRQQAYTTKLLVEKGAALIRSFEAGARTGVGLEWGHFQLQKLLMETARQPDIDYLIVTDASGVILADSDPSLIGDSYGTDLDLRRIAGTEMPQWRRVPHAEGADTFEIYRQFMPAGEDIRSFHHRIRPQLAPPAVETGGTGLVIFVGLDMSAVESARREDNRHTVMMAVIFLLVGISGFISLMLAQNYRSTRMSLSRVQAFSDHLVANMPIGLMAVDRNGRITAFNQTAESILHRNAGETVGRKAVDILPGPCVELLRSLENENRTIEREIDCPLMDGRSAPLEIIATVLGGEGDGHESVMLFRDVTEIRQLKNEIARSRRLASLGSLAAGVAHEIRNPLSSIKGFATYFKERYRNNPEDSKTADILIQEVDRLNRVISQLLDFTRPMQMHRTRTSVQAVIRQALRVIEAQAREKGISIETDLASDLPEISIDIDRMKQVFLNLFLNALGAMEGGGILSVSSLLQMGKAVRIEVRDNGVGIASGDLERIFDPYFTTKASGTGLGLAIVQKIVEAHAGEIHVESSLGQGTIVSILLPLS